MVLILSNELEPSPMNVLLNQQVYVIKSNKPRPLHRKMLRVNCFVVAASSFVCLAAVISGLHIGGFNGVLEMDGFKDTFSHLYQDTNKYENQSYENASDVELNRTSCSAGNGASSDSVIGTIVSSGSFGSFVGSLIAGWLSDQFGRKYGLVVGGVVLVAGTGFLAASYYVWMLIVGRLLSGIAIGIFYMVMPVYIAEIAPKESRGMLGSMIGPAFNLGVTFVLLINIGCSRFSVGWRVTIAFVAIIALFYAIGMKFMPYTPRWLVKKGRDHEAILVLSKINHLSGKESFVDTYLDLEELRQTTRLKHQYGCGQLLKELYQYKYRFLMIIVMFFFESFMGKFIFYYSTTIFCKVGVPAFIASLVVGMVVIIATIVLMALIDRVGRKTLYVFCTILTIVSGVIVAALLHVSDTSSEAVQYAIVVLICAYTFGYACSWQTVTWVVNSEIFPINIRGVVVAVSTGLYWFFNFVINQTLPLLISSPLQLFGYFYLLSVSNFLALLFVLFFLPETKGVSLEGMDALFTQSIWQRFIGTFKCSSGTVPVTLSDTAQDTKEMEVEKEMEAMKESRSMDKDKPHN